MKAQNTNDLFANVIKDLYSAEEQLAKSLDKIAKKAGNDRLVKGFEEHKKVTEKQMQRLEQIAEMLDTSPRGKKSVAMEGIVNEMEANIEEIENESLIDAELIMSAQKAEHYEIASYGSACAFAKLMGNDKALDLLKETLEEEKEQDKLLTELAEESVNMKAMNDNEQ